MFVYRVGSVDTTVHGCMHAWRTWCSACLHAWQYTIFQFLSTCCSIFILYMQPLSQTHGPNLFSPCNSLFLLKFYKRQLHLVTAVWGYVLPCSHSGYLAQWTAWASGSIVQNVCVQGISLHLAHAYCFYTHTVPSSYPKGLPLLPPLCVDFPFISHRPTESLTHLHQVLLPPAKVKRHVSSVLNLDLSKGRC